MEKIHVYFMPGLAASPLIFEYIKLPADVFEVHYLTWILPEGNEPLADYVKRLSKEVKHESPVLVGVSFGGIIVQEMAKLVDARKVIIVSSVKCNREFPRRMRLAKRQRLYRFFPTRMMSRVEVVNKWFSADGFIKRRLELYEKYLSVRDKKYLDWAFEKVIEWDRTEPDPRVVHIHGTGDGVFPCRYIKGYIPVEGGTHIMVINRAAWFNQHLPGIILGTDTKKIEAI